MRVHASLVLASALLFGGARAAEPPRLSPPRSDRAAAARPRTVTLGPVLGDRGTPEARAALREALARHLRRRGFSVVDAPGTSVRYRLQPTVLVLDGAGASAGTHIEVKASIVALDRRGRIAAMVEGGARATSATPGAASANLEAQAVEAAARNLAEDLARRILEGH